MAIPKTIDDYQNAMVILKPIGSIQQSSRTWERYLGNGHIVVMHVYIKRAYTTIPDLPYGHRAKSRNGKSLAHCPDCFKATNGNVKWGLYPCKIKKGTIQHILVHLETLLAVYPYKVLLLRHKKVAVTGNRDIDFPPLFFYSSPMMRNIYKVALDRVPGLAKGIDLYKYGAPIKPPIQKEKRV